MQEACLRHDDRRTVAGTEYQAITLAGLLFGRYIFQGLGRHIKSEMATFAFLTMIVIIAPAVMDGQVGSDAGHHFMSAC